MRRSFQVLFLSLVVAGSASGADNTGNFFLGGGAGAITCHQFVSVMEKARSAGIGTVEFVNQTQGFTMYILGFQTGYNMGKPGTYDIFPRENDNYPLLSWVENWCRVHPKARFSDGVVALAKDRQPKRQKTAPIE